MNGKERENMQVHKHKATAWVEEIEAIRNIKTGRTKMVKQSADKLLDELKELENE